MVYSVINSTEISYCSLILNDFFIRNQLKSNLALDQLLGIRIPEVQELKGSPQRESKSMRRRRIFSLLDCGQCSGIVHGSRMATDSPVNDWFLTSKS